MSDKEGQMNRTACASCKHQRKKCHEGCVMAPHFPQRLTAEFETVHKIFGIANVTKAIKPLDFAGQQEAIKSFIWEAMVWDKDPVHGPLGQVKFLRDRIMSLEEENKKNEVVIKNMSQQLLGQWNNINGVANFNSESSSSAMNVNNYGGVLEEKDGNGLAGRIIQGVNPNYFNYGHSSFVQDSERAGSSGGGGIYTSGYGQGSLGMGRGYDGVLMRINVVGDGQAVMMTNQGIKPNHIHLCPSQSGTNQRIREGIFGQYNCSTSTSGVVLPRGERVRVLGDHGIMQYAASHMDDFTTSSQQHVIKNTNQNNSNLPESIP